MLIEHIRTQKIYHPEREIEPWTSSTRGKYTSHYATMLLNGLDRVDSEKLFKVVPQVGNILGPLLLLYYVYDMINSINEDGKIILYAGYIVILTWI